ncbi:PQ loop repeat domain containing protein [Elaphomyces granulatus]|jgi:uncharacterized protein with PQ loop repeat
MLIPGQHHGSTAPPNHYYCEPVSPFLALISSWLHVCIPTPLALTSSILGSLSILSWLFAQLPQIYRNYYLQSTAGLSVFFLMEWCLGDTANLFGAILTRQAGWQVTIAAYYVLVDIVLVFQYYWYTYCQGWGKGKTGLYSVDYRDRSGDILEGVSPAEVALVRDMSPIRSSERKDARPEDRKPLSSPDSLSLSSSNEKLGSSSHSMHRLGPGNSSLAMQRTLLLASMLCAVAVNASPTKSSWTPELLPSTHEPISSTIGCILSWMSTVLYLASRLPQLYKNYCRQSTAGLSPLLFVAAFCGNLFYSLSLLTNPNAWYDFPPYGGGGWVDERGNNRWKWVGRATPFFLGAAGVLTLDALMGLQFWMYGEQGEEPVVRVEDPEWGRRRWQRVTGWMRGWIPSGDSKRTPVSTDTQALLPQEHIRYGAA